MKRNITPSTVFKILSGISTAMFAPASDPRIVGIERYRAFLVFNTFFLEKLAVAEIFCSNIEIRFVPFATLGERPNKLSNGNVRNEPPPARTFIIPEAKPPKTAVNKA